MLSLNDLKIKIIKTQDGSLGLYNLELDEIYHSKYGAKKEALEKFIEPCYSLNLNKPLEILDICYGIGYNTKTALLKFPLIDRIDCLEINEELVKKSYMFEFDEKINSIIKSCLEKEGFIRFFIDDARKSILKLDKKYDIIFHDGFCPHKDAKLWSEDFIFQVAKLLKQDGIYATYNHSKPVLGALSKTGLIIGKTIKENRTIGTIASFNSSLIKNPLDNNELKELQTKTAITYKDKNLDLSHSEIVKNREIEVKNSNLITLSKLKKNFYKIY